MGESKWRDKWEPTGFKKHIEKELALTEEQEMVILRKAARICPEVLQVLLDNPKWYCPFPYECNRFPCGESGCNADMCHHGYAFRYS